jgi:LEA14-like dessication related protein
MATSCTSGSTSRPIRAAVVLAALSLAACAPFARLEPPEVVTLAVRNVEIRLPTIRVDTELTLRNPNAVDVSVASLDADLEIAGERAGTLKLAAPVTLPAGGTSAIALSAVGDAAVALTGLGRTLARGSSLDYALKGALVLADGRAFPFVRRGQVAPPRRP